MILHEFYDHEYPQSGFNTIRRTARSLTLNDEGKLGFLHVVGEDFFGVRDHLETIGGGLEIGESDEAALQREVQEEIGYTCTIVADLGKIIDRYNLIDRITVSHFFVSRIGERVASNRTEEEKILLEGVLWLSLEEALAYYEKPLTKVNLLIQQRDQCALLAYQAWLKQ